MIQNKIIAVSMFKVQYYENIDDIKQLRYKNEFD